MNLIAKSLKLNNIKAYYNFKSNLVFANFLGIKANTLSNWHSRNSIDYELIISKCVGINGHWLLTGEGEMFQEEATVQSSPILQEPVIAAASVICASCGAKQEIIEILREQLQQKNKEIDCLFSLLEHREDGANIKKSRRA